MGLIPFCPLRLRTYDPSPRIRLRISLHTFLSPLSIMMAWNTQKKTPSEMEKGSDIDSVSSFGSPKKNIVALPPPAKLPSSPTKYSSTQSGTDSQFTSSFTTSHVTEPSKRRAWMRRHAFLILLAVVLILIAITVSVILVIKARYAHFVHDTPAPGTAGIPGLFSSESPSSTAS